MRSMTGYSKLSYQNENFRLGIEIKSVNNKNLNLKIKLPNSLNFLENKIRAQVGTYITRGSIDLRIDFEDKRDKINMFEYDEEMSKAYLTLLDKMEMELENKFSNKMNYLLNLNIIKKKEDDMDGYEEILGKKIDEVLKSFIKFKLDEGLRLKEYFKKRISFIEDRLRLIKTLKNEVVKNYREKLLKRLDLIRGEIVFKEEDILKEILLFTDKCDISEEISRLESHLEQLKIELESENIAVGKKIDFILQEIFRELNTTGVKSNYYDISKIVVECKNELEKIREQAMNIE